jgi:hypothetical protein
MGGRRNEVNNILPQLVVYLLNQIIPRHMKDPIKNVELSFACPEKWENLVDAGDNKMCLKCKHLVVDFTKLSKEEFDDAVRKAPGRLCGRFKQSQMSPRFLKYAAATAMVASVLAPTSCGPDDMFPAEEQTPPPQPELIEYHTVGIVFTPDTIVHEGDTTFTEGPIDEDEYFREE